MSQRSILINQLKKEIGAHNAVVYEICADANVFADFPNATVIKIPYRTSQIEKIKRELTRTCVDMVYTDVRDDEWLSFLSEAGISLCLIGGGVDGRPATEFSNKRKPGMGDTIAIRICDLIGGIIGSVICGVLFIFLAPAIKIESRGPVIFRQERIGLNGRRFMCYKFRTMYYDAEKAKDEISEADGQICQHMFKVENDKRITRIGKFLRQSSLDEFPQFINVLLGQMSIVGTRPPTVDEWNSYEPKHRKRLIRKPGITGMWQVSGRNNITDFDEVVALDMQYIRNRTVKNYFKIIGKTFRSVKNLEGR